MTDAKHNSSVRGVPHAPRYDGTTDCAHIFVRHTVKMHVYSYG